MGKFVTRNHHAQRIEKMMLSRKAKAERRGQKKSVARTPGKAADKGSDKSAGKDSEKGPDAPAK